MNETRHFDLCVVGAGSAGYAAAVTGRSLGKSVAVVETSHPLAGLCILRGCMPSKTLLRSAEIAHLARRAREVGVEVGSVRPRVDEIVERKRRIIKGFADHRIEGIESFPLFRGAPAFVSADAVRVENVVITADRFVIATGSKTQVIEFPGLQETGFVTSDDVLEMETLPKSVLVLGGGPTAVELAQYLARMDVETTIVQRSKTLLSDEDVDVATSLRASLERDGITVLTGTAIEAVAKSDGLKEIRLRHDGAEKALRAEEIFVATGRGADLPPGLGAAGVDHDPRGIKVDRYLRTSNPRMYAAGDVIFESTQLVHVAVLEGQTAVRNAFGAVGEPIDYDLQGARAIFTDPQVAIAGLRERDCAARGIAYATAMYPFDDLGKAIAADLTAGFVKMLAAMDGTILGVAIVGAEAADLIHEAIALLYFKANVRDVLMMPHLHPTLAEILTYPAEELCERLENQERALVTP
jgi:pyruvate/2-oxoglutarate dehydrogenase complex dihydrolipoamide dehydrogenase (E3) component